MIKLLIDEHLSPKLAMWCAERRGLYAASVPHVGLSGRSDPEVWRYAYEHDFVVVTTNVRDFLELLDVDLHPGLIVLRESGLSRMEQWERLELALDHILRQSNPADYMINRVVQVTSAGGLSVQTLPPSSTPFLD